MSKRLQIRCRLRFQWRLLSDPSKLLRVFWALLMGAVAVLLLTIGEDSVNSLQSFIVVTAVPVFFLMLTTFWTAPKVCKEMAKEQQIGN